MQQEKTMRKTTRLALVFAALAGAVGTAAYADEHSGAGPRDGMMMRLGKVMKDNDGTITFDRRHERAAEEDGP